MRSVRLLLCCLVIVGCSRGTGGSLPVVADPNGGAILSDTAQHTAPSFGRWQSRDVATFKTLYFFKDTPDGANSAALLIDVDGALYGTTAYGGAGCPSPGCGTVFTITPSGTESVLYNFKGGSDGSRPFAGLIAFKGTLYGTTVFGGALGGNCGSVGCGTVFTITPSGTEAVLHSFTSYPDGSGPDAGVIDVNGTLYGTTSGGGVSGAGAVFKITPSGTESVLHSFSEHSSDGFSPEAGLVDVNGTLYGTTLQGGLGAGIVFKITPSGTESVLYAFKNHPDGATPFASLINVDGTLYGTTNAGGDLRCGFQSGCGTVFKVTTSGVESVLYRFKGGSDGSFPGGALLDVNGAMYGTTENTVFKIAGSGTQTVLHRFTGPDGYDLAAGLLDVNGTFYGTTGAGGTGCSPSGCGTVFSLRP